MSVKFALLILLDKEPASGYDLAQRFNRGIGQFWQCSHQQIYQQLKKSHAEGLLSFVVEKQRTKPDRKIYRITDQGSAALTDWLAAQEKMPTVRDALLIKIYAAARGDERRLQQEVERHIGLHQAQLRAHREEEQLYFQADEATQHKRRWPYLTLRRGIRYEQEWLAWLQEVHDCLAQGEFPRQPLG